VHGLWRDGRGHVAFDHKAGAHPKNLRGSRLARTILTDPSQWAVRCRNCQAKKARANGEQPSGAHVIVTTEAGDGLVLEDNSGFLISEAVEGRVTPPSTIRTRSRHALE
jgi:hypothetical protein